MGSARKKVTNYLFPSLTKISKIIFYLFNRKTHTIIILLPVPKVFQETYLIGGFFFNFENDVLHKNQRQLPKMIATILIGSIHYI